MKIMVLSSHTPSLIWFRMDMMLSFIKAGCEVVAVGNEDEALWQHSFFENKIKYRKAYIIRNGTNPINDLKTLKSLRKIIKEEKPDKIFAYQAKTIVYGSLAAHRYNIEIYSLIAGIGSIFLSKGLKAKLIKLILKEEYRKALKYNEKVFFQNNDDVQIFLSNKIVSNKKIEILHGSGVNLEKFCTQPLPTKFGILYIGRLIRDKGVFEYLEACNILKQRHYDIRCMLVGPYDSNPTALTEKELKPYIEKGIIEYFGEQRDVRPYLNECSVFVLPSYREGTPKAVLEAMATQRAIITTDAPGCRETVINGLNGYLVPIKNSMEIVKKVEYLYANKQKLNEMAIEGRKLTESIFDVNLVNENILKVMKIRGVK